MSRKKKWMAMSSKEPKRDYQKVIAMWKKGVLRDNNRLEEFWQ